MKSFWLTSFANADLIASGNSPVRIVYDAIRFEEGFRIDLLVGGKVVVELKSIDEVTKVHRKIVLTYLRLTEKRLGLLINFGSALLKDGITRVVNGLPE